MGKKKAIMKKMAMRKVLSYLVVFLILTSAMPVSVFASNSSDDVMGDVFDSLSEVDTHEDIIVSGVDDVTYEAGCNFSDSNSTGNVSNRSNDLEKTFTENNSAEVMIPLFNNNITGKYRAATWTEEDSSSGDCAPIPDVDMPEIYLNDTQESVASRDSANGTVAVVMPDASNDTDKNVSALGCNVYVKIDDDTCAGYDVYVDGVYKLTEGEGGTPDGYCAFYVSAGTHTIEIRKNGCSASITKNFQCGITYRWVSMPDYWCECGDQEGSREVKFRGTAQGDPFGDSSVTCQDVSVTELISGGAIPDYVVVVLLNRAPKGYFDSSIQHGDKVEVYGKYSGSGCDISINGENYYIKKVEPSETLSLNVWTDKSEYKIGETVTIYYQTNKKCTAKLTITKPDGGDIVYGPNEIPASTRSKSATAGYPTGKRTVVFEAWAGDEYKKATCYFEVVEEAKKVKIRGEILVDSPIISFYSFDVKIDEILEDPTGNLQKGEIVNVYGYRSGPAQVDDVTVGDKVEVFGEYRGYVGTYEQIYLSDWSESSSDHYVKKIDKITPGSFEIIRHGYEVGPKYKSLDCREYKDYFNISVKFHWEDSQIERIKIKAATGESIESDIFPEIGDSLSLDAQYGKITLEWVDLWWVGTPWHYVFNYVVEPKGVIEKPDLIIQDISLSPQTPKNGDTVTFTVKIKNQGSKNAEGFYVCYYIDGSYYAREYISSLSAGSTTTTSFTWIAECGTHSIKAYTDCYDAINESNEDNNEKSIIIEVGKKSVHNIDTGKDFTTIQAAIDDSDTGHTITVDAGTYVENVEVTKSLTIKSTSGNPKDTIVQAAVSNQNYQNVFTVTADNVHIDGFTIKGASYLWCSGILIGGGHCVISNNTFEDNAIGIWTHPPSGTDNTIRNNNFASSSEKSPSTALYIESSGNKIYLNNFFIGTMGGGSYFSTLWNSPSKITYTYNGNTFTDYLGNYWADYQDKYPGAKEKDNTGIWDTSYEIDGDKDNYPLVETSDHYMIKIDEKKPDLVIESISWSPSSPKKGDTVTFYVEVKNQGSGDAGTSYVVFWAGVGYIPIHSSVPALSSGSNYTWTLTWPADKCGDRQVKAVADGDNHVAESDEGNNDRTATMNVACPVEIKFTGNLESIDAPMGYTCYIFKIDEVLTGPQISGRIGIMVWDSTIDPGESNFSSLKKGDRAEVYAVYLGKQHVPWSPKEEHMGSIVSDYKYYVKKIADIRIVDNDRVLIKENVPQLVDPNIKWDEYAEVSIYTKRISSDLIDLYVELNSIVLKIDKKTEEAKGVSFGDGFYEGAISVLVDENAVILWPESKLLVRAEEFKLGSWPNDITYHGSLNVKERAKKHEDFYGVQKVVYYEGGNITPAFYYKYRGEMPYSDWKASYYFESPSQFLAGSLPHIGWLFTLEDLLDHLVKKGVIYARLLDKYPSEIPVENYDEILRTWMGVDLTGGVPCDFDSVVMKVPIKIDPSKTHKVSVRGKASPYVFEGDGDITFAKDFDINLGHESSSPVTAGEPGYIDFRSEEGSLRILDEKVITKRVHYIVEEKIKFTVILLPSRDDPKTNYIFIEVSQCPREIDGTRQAYPGMLRGFASIVIDERAQVDQNRIVTKYLNTEDFPCEPPLVPLLYPDMYKVIPELEDDNLGAVLKDVLSLVIPLVKIPRYGKICGIINSIPDLYLALNGSPKEVKEAFANDEEMDEYNTLWCHKELGRIEAHNNVVTVIPVRFYLDNNKIAVRAGVFKAGIIGGELEFLYSNTLDLSNGRPYESPIADKDILILSCPIKATITDQYNRIISDDGTNEIPNADMLITNETKIFYLPANLMYSVDIDAYDTGTFNFTRVSPIGKDISITKFENIPVTSNTKAFVDIAPGLTDYTMSIDYDGDGEIDEEKGPDVNETIEVGQDLYPTQLQKGWNLISLPLTPEDTDILNAMSSVEGNWNSVWSYEGGKWKRYDLTGPDFLNTLTIMEPGKGYWLNIKSDDTLSISGSEPGVKSIPLSAGWNLVGYNSLNSMPTTDAMSSVEGNWNSVWSYDGGNWKRYDLMGPDFLNSLTFMEPGKGYWLNMKSPDTWTLGA